MKLKLTMFLLGLFVVCGLYVVRQKEVVVTQQIKQKGDSVPLPKAEDAIQIFFGLVDEGRVSEAVEMMAPESIGDESQKQAWGVMWNAFDEIKVTNLAKIEESLYKVSLKTRMKEGFEDIIPMPYYGYGNGDFVRWVEVVNVEGVWKIRGIATGP